MEDCSGVLDLIGQLEQQMSVYREDSELNSINRWANEKPVKVEKSLFELLCQAQAISVATERAFDPTSGPLVALWRSCRQQDRIPRFPGNRSLPAAGGNRACGAGFRRKYGSI